MPYPTAAPRNELAICCRALAPLLGEQSPPARALAHAAGGRAQPALLSHDAARPAPGLRARAGRRRPLAGGAPGAPPASGGRGADAAPAARRRATACCRWRCACARGRDTADSIEVELDGPSGTHRTELALAAPPRSPPRAASWSCPRSRGGGRTPTASPLCTTCVCWSTSRKATPRGAVAIDAGRIGFRELAFGATPAHDVERDGLDLHVNGVRGVRTRRGVDADRPGRHGALRARSARCARAACARRG